MIDKIINEIDNKENVLILGFGKEGKSTYNLIRKYLTSKKLTIADSNVNLLLDNEFLKNDNNLDVVLGDNYLNSLKDYDLIIKSPGVNFKFISTDKFVDNITSQLELFLKYCDSKTIGVTGTKGKSTTSSLIYYILNNLGKDTILVGNIGVPVFERLEDISKNTLVVIEMGVHQLQFLKHSPDISAILNVYEEHLDHYKSYDEYIQSKYNIFKFQKKDSYQILGVDSDSKSLADNLLNLYKISTCKSCIDRGILIEDKSLYLIKNSKCTLIYSDNRKRKLLGNHNLYNIACSLCVCDILNLDLGLVSSIIDEFSPLEHRMEYVGTYKDISFYNDSIATIPLAAINCFESIDNIETVIIGGMDRGINLDILIDYLNNNEKILNCIFLKDTGYMIADKLESLKCSKKIIRAKDMDEAVKVSYQLTTSGKACCLSPAAASYNNYKNFEERGNDFKNCVLKYNF